MARITDIMPNTAKNGDHRRFSRSSRHLFLRSRKIGSCWSEYGKVLVGETFFPAASLFRAFAGA